MEAERCPKPFVENGDHVWVSIPASNSLSSRPLLVCCHCREMRDGLDHRVIKPGEQPDAAPEMPRPPGTVHGERLSPPDGGTETGTGVPEDPGAAQAGHWLKFDTIAREITGCQCGFRADMDSDCGWGDSVVAHLFEVAAEAARPVHYREAANSLRGYATGRHVGDTYDSGFVDGITAAADRIDSYARDLKDESPSLPVPSTEEQ